MLTTDQKGAIAEAKIVAAALELGVGVYVPFAQGGRTDMLFEIGTRLLRVQCKWASLYRDALVVRCCRARRNADGLLRQYYTADEVDLFAVYSAHDNRTYLIPFEDVPPGAVVQLRLTAARNNQARRIRWARTYEFAATLQRLGAVAQLGERAAGSR